MPSVFSAIGDLMQKQPKVPKIKPIDVGAEAGKAVASNQKNLPEIEKLASASNAYARQEQLKALDEFLGVGTRQQILENIGSASRGELPKDVQDLIQRKAAERSTAGGYGGSVAGRNLGLRDLGLVSLQRSDYALDAASRWLNTAQQGMPTFNYTSMFVTPEMQVQQANADRSAIFQRNWMKNQLDAAYSASSIFGQNLKAFDEQMSRWMDSTYGTILSVAASKMGGQGQPVAPSTSNYGQSGPGYGGGGGMSVGQNQLYQGIMSQDAAQGPSWAQGANFSQGFGF